MYHIQCRVFPVVPTAAVAAWWFWCPYRWRSCPYYTSIWLCLRQIWPSPGLTVGLVVCWSLPEGITQIIHMMVILRKVKSLYKEQLLMLKMHSQITEQEIWIFICQNMVIIVVPTKSRKAIVYSQRVVKGGQDEVLVDNTHLAQWRLGTHDPEIFEKTHGVTIPHVNVQFTNFCWISL